MARHNAYVTLFVRDYIYRKKFTNIDYIFGALQCDTFKCCENVYDKRLTIH